MGTTALQLDGRSASISDRITLWLSVTLFGSVISTAEIYKVGCDGKMIMNVEQIR
jgi:hypothetical protein